LKKLSVIIPVYNNENYINGCLDSLKNLKNVDWECIVVDDGSTDNSALLAEKYSEKDKRIRVFRIKNDGVSAARNFGIENSIGDAVLFLDSDDWFLDNIADFISDAVESFEEKTLCVFSHKRVYPDGKKILYNISRAEGDYKKKVKSMTLYTQELNRCWGILFGIKTIEENNVRFIEGMKVAEDTCFVLDYLKYAKDIKIINKPLIAYRMNDSGAMSRTDINTIKDSKKSFYKRKELFDELGINLSKEEFGVMCNFYFSDIVGYISTECAFSSYKNARKVIEDIFTSEYGKTLLEGINESQFSTAKRFLVFALKNKRYHISYSLMKFFGKRNSNR
jgi:glycosyltransferase involved in cell wall biosynthesis